MPNSNIIMYTTEDGNTKIEATFENDTVWLSLDQMSELFQRDKSTVSRHIKNIFSEGELIRESVVAKFATTASDGKTYNVEYYNLDVIISVGYRVKSVRGTQFRIWASEKMTRRDILLNNGSISHKQAIEKAHKEYEKYKKKQHQSITKVERDFIDSIGRLEKLETKK